MFRWAGLIVLIGVSLTAHGAEVTCTANTERIAAYDVFELTFGHENHYSNPFFDVTLDVTFTSPSGKKIAIGGFHYGTLEKPKVRMATPTTRSWRQRSVFYDFD